MNKQKYIVWSNADLDYDDWREDIEAENPGISEEDGIELMYRMNDEHLDDERMNLDIQLDSPIIVIANLGLWNGRRSGYQIIKSGNIKDCLRSFTSGCGDITWYVNGYGDLKCDETHHDGVNHYTFRAWKPGVTELRKESFLYKVYSGTVTPAHVSLYTQRIGDKIAAVYGWKVR